MFLGMQLVEEWDYKEAIKLGNKRKRGKGRISMKPTRQLAPLKVVAGFSLCWMTTYNDGVTCFFYVH